MCAGLWSCPGCGARRVQTREERAVGAAEALERQRAGDVGLGHQSLRRQEEQDAQGGHELCPLDQGEAFFWPQDEGRDAGADHRCISRHLCALVDGFPFTDHHQGEMRQRREVSAGAERPLRRDQRMDASADHLNEGVDDDRTHARIAAGQGIGTQDHHGTYGRFGQRGADPRRVGADDVLLQLRSLERGDRYRAELVHAGRDAVHGPLVSDDVVDDGVGCFNAPARRGRQHDGGTVRHRFDRLGRQHLTVKFDHPVPPTQKATPQGRGPLCICERL